MLLNNTIVPLVNVCFTKQICKWKTNKLFGVNNEEDGDIVGVYGNKIYCTIGIDPGNLYCYNLKTQKRKSYE